MRSNKNIKIAIVGLGYVGLPLFLLFSKKFETYGFENDKKKIECLKQKKSYIADIKSSHIKRIKIGNLFLNNLEKINECSHIIFTLPTPIKNYKPDLRYYVKSVNNIFKFIKKGQTLIFESTVYPGATEELFLKKLNNKFKVGKELFLCYSPERVDPGKTRKKKLNLQNINKLVSGHSQKCLKKIYKLYSSVFENLYKCTSIKEAECAKVYENTFRYVNISFVNEFKIICDKLNIDVNRVIDASATKPFGFKAFRPGPGIGGHCIPVDPFYLKWFAQKYNVKTKFIDTSKKLNKDLQTWIKNKINKHIKKYKKILVVGIAYKKNVNDLRESPSFKIYKNLLKNKKLHVNYIDTYVKSVKVRDKTYFSIKNSKIKNIDLSIILTDHDNIRFGKILKNSKLVLDSRNVFKNFKKHRKILNI